MTLYCSCDWGDSDFDPDDWYYSTPSDYEIFSGKRRKRCCSCREFIAPGELAVRFNRRRDIRNDIEERIYGDVIELADWWMCEQCGDLYFSLIDLGYCIALDGDRNMQNLVKEHNLIQAERRGHAELYKL